MRLVFTAAAADHLRDADEWWTKNRTAAPGLLRSELNRACELITMFPGAGSIATNVELPGVRRVLLPRTRYHLYYQASKDLVEVLALWHSSRGGAPAG